MNAHASTHKRPHDEALSKMPAPAKSTPTGTVGVPLFMREMSTAGGTLQRQCASVGSPGANDECETCNSGKSLQAKLAIGASDDPLEQEADRVADQVLAMPANSTVSAAPPRIQRYAGQASKGTGTAPASVDRVLASNGKPLDATLQQDMGQRFGHDFSRVRVHSGAAAEQSARDVNAHAYTVGRDIVFGVGQFSPATPSGRRLLAHELTHVVQQEGGHLDSVIQRDCSDQDFCKPYATKAEADSAEWWIRNTYFRAEGVETYGTEAKELYESYLSRSPGDSLTPVVFDNDASHLVSSFRDSGDTKNDMDAVIDLVGERLNRAPSGSIKSTQTTMSLSNFLSPAEMNSRPINYSNPFSVAGHIAGGIGSSDAGSDYRKISANVTLEKTTLMGLAGYVSVELIPHYEVFDAIDFCPGDCGSPIEQVITIPMSRLEASGAAYDVPFKVMFSPEPRSKRIWF